MNTINKAKDTIEENIDFISIFFKYIKNLIPNIILSILIIIIGYFIANFFRKKLKFIMKNKGADMALVGFFSQVLFFFIIILTIVMALGVLGVPTSSFVATIGGLGIAIGLALQSNLSNFASGIIILIFKPFKIDDFIETSDGVSGTVYSISTMNTCLNTVDNKKIYIPNQLLTSNYLINFSQNELRTLVLNFKLEHNSDYNLAMSIITNILKSNKYTTDTKNVLCEINELAPNYISIIAKAGVENTNYFPMQYSVMKNIKDEFNRNNIEFAKFNFISQK